MRSTFHVPSFNFFPWCGFRDTEVQSFSIFPIWLPHYVTYDIIVMIETFYMSRHNDGENFISIRQAVGEKNTTVLCGQTNKQTIKSDRQTNGAKCNELKIIPKYKAHPHWLWTHTKLAKTVKTKRALFDIVMSSDVPPHTLLRHYTYLHQV